MKSTSDSHIHPTAAQTADKTKSSFVQRHLGHLGHLGLAMPGVLTLLAILSAGTAQAASLTWDADTVTAGAQDGDGTWNQTNTNYWDGAANDTYDTFDNITFGSGGTGTVTLGTNQIRGGGNHITFANDYTIDTNGSYIGGQGNNTIRTKANVDASIIGSGEFLMYVNSSLRTESGSTLTMDAKITEASGVENLTKTDVGTLILNGANTYTGTTFINGGTIVAGVNDVAATSGALGNGGNIDFGSGTLQYATGVTQDYSSRIVNSTSAIIVDTNGEEVLWDTALANTNTGGLTKEGSGLLRIQATSDYDGATTINGGTLRIRNVTGSTGWKPGAININNGSTLQFTGSQQTILQNAGDNITFDSNGGGSMVMTKNTIWRNAHIVTTGGARNTVSGTYFNGQVGGGGNRVIYDVADGTDAGGIDLLVSSEHRNVGGITKNGAGTLALTSGTNTMNGGTVVISDGILEIANTGRLQSGNYADAITINGDAETIFRYNSSQAQTLSGVISGVGSLEKDNSSTLTLSGDNTYSGNTTVSAGTLALSHASLNNIIGNSTIINVANSATLNVSALGGGTGGLELAAGQTISGSGTVVGDMTIGSGSVLSPGNSPGTLSQTGDQTWIAGGAYLWEINDRLGTKGEDPGWDWISIDGTLDLSLLTVDGFTIDIDSLSDASPGDALNFVELNHVPEIDYSFIIASATGGISGFDAGDFSLDDSGFTNAGWLWSIRADTNNLYLDVNFVPEPSSTALLGLGGLALMLRRKRS
jgi:fibronectin-binding autotransporter adhesin